MATVTAKDRNPGGSYPAYILITPARNEESFIGNLIESVIHQTVLPKKWVIVNDGSTDKTAEVVNRYIVTNPWIDLVNRPPRKERSFSAKVHAFNAGYEKVKAMDFEVLGNLDADVTFESDYIELLLGKFRDDAKLGVAGTVFEEEGYSSERQSFEGQNHVAGGCQMFRKRCFEEIGGFLPNKAGGVDWMAVTSARMMGWKTRAFREKSFFHHRHLGTAERSVLASSFSYGEKDYYLGGHPVWELFRVAYRATKRPYLFDGLALGLGYCWAFIRQTPRPVSRELMAFHRKEQMAKLKAILRNLIKFRRVDSFHVEPV